MIKLKVTCAVLDSGKDRKVLMPKGAYGLYVETPDGTRYEITGKDDGGLEIRRVEGPVSIEPHVSNMLTLRARKDR